MRRIKASKKVPAGDGTKRPASQLGGAVGRLSLTDAAVGIIRDRILDLTLPPSTRIDETMLSERFDLSRTPAREALNRLAAEGLVSIHHNRGTVVSPLDINNIREFFHAYFAAERLVGFFCNTRHKNLTPDLMEIDREYKAQLDNKNYLQLTKINSSFHTRIALATENKYFIEFSERLHNQARRISYYIFMWDNDSERYKTHQDRVTRDHGNIIRTIHRNDNPNLIELLTRHAHLFQERIHTLMDSSIAAQSPLPEAGAGP